MIGDDFDYKSSSQSEDTTALPCVNLKHPGVLAMSDLPPARDVPDKCYSVQADMVNGWRPKDNKDVQIPNNDKIIIPLKVANTLVDSMVKVVASMETGNYQIVYLGKRLQSSFEVHQELSRLNPLHKNPYAWNNLEHLRAQNQLFEGNSQNSPVGTIEFDSAIESGNLDVVIRRQSNQYDLFLRVDTNTRGHTNWFNFNVRNSDTLGQIKFNIMNLRKQQSLYLRGMRPFIRSSKEGKGWGQGGQSVTYTETKPNFYDFMNVKPRHMSRNYTLSFLYIFKHQHDQVQIAYSIPYTLSRLTRLISGIKEKEFVKVQTLCKSVGNIRVPLVTITDKETTPKKVVIITARVHPGEANSSFVAEGIILSLCSDEPLFRKIRREFIFKIVPMLNPDGVITGNYRTGFLGIDLNRVYDQDSKCFPEIVALKRLVRSQAQRTGRSVDFYIDLHGHSTRKNIFVYGPEHPMIANEYQECRVFPKHMSNLTPMFRYFSCMWRISESKESTARAVMFRKFNISNCYTMESSNGLYFDRNSGKQISFSELHWLQTGRTVCQALFETVHETTRQKLETKSFRTQKQSRKSQLVPIVKLKEKMLKCSDDELQEGDSDSEPDDNLNLEQLTRLRQIFMTQKQSKYPRRHVLNNPSAKLYSLQPKAKTILTTTQEQPLPKLPLISHRQGLDGVRHRNQHIMSRKPRVSQINLSEGTPQRHSLGTGFNSIMSRMVLNFNTNDETNNVSLRSVKEGSIKSNRYLNRSVAVREAPVPKYINNMIFE